MKKQIHQVTALLLALAMLSSCSLLSSDEPVGLSATENTTPEPTVAQVEPADPGLAAPGDAQTDTAQPGAVGAGTDGQAAAPVAQVTPEPQAALPTPIALPPTPVPPTPTPDPTKPRTYIVKSGDVLGVIAQSFDVEVADIRKANNLSGNMIKVGQQLTIPPKGGLVESPPPVAAAPATDSAPAPKPTPVTCSSTAGHCVQSGDTMSAIARKHGVTVDALRAANPGIVNDLIRIGDVVALPGSGVVTAPVTGSGPSPVVTPLPVQIVPQSDADCRARYPRTATSEGYPYYHEGKCYQSPIGPAGSTGSTGVTPGPTKAPAKHDCPAGYVGWNDGLCYPYSGTPVATATPRATPESSNVRPNAQGQCPANYSKLSATVCLLNHGVTVTATPTPKPDPNMPMCDNGGQVTDKCHCRGGDILSSRCYHPAPTPTP